MTHKTEDNQIWKIKDSFHDNQLVTLDGSKLNDIERLWRNGKGYLILSVT